MAIVITNRVFLTHGEEKAALALAEQVWSQWRCAVSVPSYQESVLIGDAD